CWFKMRMTRSRACATVAFTASVVGVNALSSRGESSRMISLTCKSCVRYMRSSVAKMGFAKSGNRILLDKVRLLDIFRRRKNGEQPQHRQTEHRQAQRLLILFRT